ncbi:MAG: hydroxymethylglutaryl-CoA lyase, partial [Chloroflexi bacterium]|nr:hydroxymethylglutaryl-CoA lyase [Chloroflexota bacterium]
ISVFVSASETANRNNVGRSVAESMNGAAAAIAEARRAGLFAIGTVATAFGSPYGEEIAPDAVVGLAERFVAAGATGVALGDTSGDATPRRVEELTARLIATFPGVGISLHFHDTRGCGLANVLAAMDAGATTFDSAVGGIGGSPFTANSLGNVSTEDLLHLCEGARIGTGVDLAAILDVYRFLEKKLDHPLPGKLGRVPRTVEAATA